MASVTPTALMARSPGLPSGEIEIMFTLLGDANLDGIVNSEDFTPFSANVGKNGSWDQGDFNYDGTVNSEDFTPFSADLNQSATLAASENGVLLSPLIGADSLSLTNVPEPASIGLADDCRLRFARPAATGFAIG